jgi:uncharacterized protein YkwD
MSSVMYARRLLLPALVIAVLALPACARADSTERSIVRAMNSVRAASHLPLLHSNSRLARAADAHSASMLRSRVLTHGAFSARLRHYVHSRKVGENLAWMSRCDATAIVQMWLNSAAHRAIMLSPSFRRVGVGKRSGAGMCVVTADFASAH